MDNTIKLDIRGQICPSCLLLTLREVNNHAKELRNGQCAVEVLTNDRQATDTIPAAINKMGFHVEVDKNEQGYRISISAPSHT